MGMNTVPCCLCIIAGNVLLGILLAKLCGAYKSAEVGENAQENAGRKPIPVLRGMRYIGGGGRHCPRKNTQDEKVHWALARLLGFADEDWMTGAHIYVFVFDDIYLYSLGYGFSTTSTGRFASALFGQLQTRKSGVWG